jgi:hypothetical protein
MGKKTMCEYPTRIPAARNLRRKIKELPRDDIVQSWRKAVLPEYRRLLPDLGCLHRRRLYRLFPAFGRRRFLTEQCRLRL